MGAMNGMGRAGEQYVGVEGGGGGDEGAEGGGGV